MDWKNANLHNDGLVKIPDSWLHLHYYEALNILFRFENSLRVFVYVILKHELLEKWSDASFNFSGEQKSIKNIASKRLKQAESFGYLGFEVKAPLMHLTSGELVEIITSDTYWKYFKNYFKGNKEIIKNKLLEIGTVRNSLAHFRPIKPEDVELIKQNSRHTLMGVEECLNNIYSFPARVPTNTDDVWYKSIESIGNEYISLTPNYSKNEKYVNVQFQFRSPQLNKSEFYTSFYAYKLGKLKPANIFILSPDIGKSVIYATEHVNQPVITQALDLDARTTINLVFFKERLESDYAIVSEALKRICSLVLEESNLLLQDHLARGELVEPVNASIWISGEGDQAKWNYAYDELWQEYEPDHPVEYWGRSQFAVTDIVANLRQFPWMPSDISKRSSFF